MRIAKTVLLAAVLTAISSAGPAAASPTCSIVHDLGPSRSGVLPQAQFVSGYCVRAGDKLYGNFDLQPLPANTVVIFNITRIGPQEFYYIVFDGAFISGHSYAWSYDVAVSHPPFPGTTIVSTNGDFAQTAGGPSTLTEDLTPGGLGAISVTKTANTVASGSVQTHWYLFGTTDISYAINLADNGSIVSVTNTVEQFIPAVHYAPEPLSLSLLGVGIAGIGATRRKKK